MFNLQLGTAYKDVYKFYIWQRISFGFACCLFPDQYKHRSEVKQRGSTASASDCQQPGYGGETEDLRHLCRCLPGRHISSVSQS